MNEKLILAGYEYAKEVYGAMGIDVDAAIAKADAIPVSMHCWQGDDVIGFDGVGELTGGIATTGNYPGRANTADQLRQDIRFAASMIPGGRAWARAEAPARWRGRSFPWTASCICSPATIWRRASPTTAGSLCTG